MTTRDYATEEAFAAKLDGYFAACGARGWLTPATIVMLPEYLGTWLVAMGEKRRVYHARRLRTAMQVMVTSNLFSFACQLPFAVAQDRIKYSLFAMKAGQMAAAYDRVFSRLAAKFRVTFVAGSILLPSPRVEAQQLTVSPGPLYNVTVVYHPDGRPDPTLVKKVFPTETELTFLTPGNVGELPVFSTPAGRLGVLLCADAWFPEAYAALRARRVELIAVPSFLPPDGALALTWEGYSGWPAPPDVDQRDPGRITEREAWRKYGLMGRIRTSGAPHGMVVPLRGELWDLGSDGAIELFREQRAWEHPDRAQAMLVNSWL
jgi:hypothetical protein